jgi:hypothetical protein
MDLPSGTLLMSHAMTPGAAATANKQKISHCDSFADPDPYVFGPPGSGSISAMYRSGSGSFYHQAKKVRKTKF